jgi:hypothetical protein
MAALRACSGHAFAGTTKDRRQLIQQTSFPSGSVTDNIEMEEEKR